MVHSDLNRQDLIDELSFKQISRLQKKDLKMYLRNSFRSTFDSRVHQKAKPIGSIAGKPIWPRVLDRVKSSAELFFDDDNFAYQMNHVGPEHLIRHMDSENNYERVIRFIDHQFGRD